MSAWTNGTYTRKGLSLLSKLTQGNSLKITKAVAGTGYVNPEILASQTAVTGIKQYLSFQAASYPAAGTCKLPVFLTNENVTTGYKARQIGLYAFDPDEGEILYFITQSEKGTEVPGAAEMPDYSATWTFYLHYGQADNVNVTVDPSHTVTVDMLNEVRGIAESGVSVAKRGKMVHFDNAAGLPFAGLKLFGKTVQNGIPSPNAPVSLVGVENPSITVYGKNLCKESAFATMSSNGAATTYDAATHTITFNEDATSQSGRYYPPLKDMVVGEIYTLSFDIRGTSGKTVYCGWGDKNTKITLTGSFTRYSCTLVAKKNSEQVIFYTEKTALGGLAAGEYMQFANVQIEMGATATDYTPYIEKQTASFAGLLHGIPVADGGNYTDENGQQWICDEIDIARGFVVNRIKQVTYDGGEAWAKSGTYSYYVRTPGSLGVQPMCNRLGAKTTDEAPYIRSGITGDGQPAIIVSVGASAGVSSVESLKAFLAQYPLTVLYALATPEETAVGNEEEKANAALESIAPATTVLNDAGAWMEVDCVKAQHETAFAMVASDRTIESKKHPGCYFRIVNGETEWINPPMVHKEEYRTSERYFGNPVHCMAIDCGGLDDGRTLSVPHGIYNLSRVLLLEGFSYDGLTPYTDAISSLSCDKTQVTVVVEDYAPAATTCSVIMKYIKK